MSEIINETVEVTNETVQKKSLIEKSKDAGSKVFNWGKDKIKYVKENPVEVIGKVTTVATVAAGVLFTAKTVRDIDRLDKTVYSDEIGEGVVLKKKLNNDNKVELDYRMKTGQTKIEALKDMGMIR